MGLPKQIQRQAEQDAEFARQVAADAATVEATDDAAAPDDEGQPTEPLQPDNAPAAPAPTEDWEQRYRSLKGMVDHIKRVAQQEVANSEARVSALEAEVAALKAAASQAPQGKVKLLTEQDKEAFGEDLIDMVRRTTREEFAEREANYEAQIAQLKAQVAGVQGSVAQTSEAQKTEARNRFFAQLDAALPNWPEIQATDDCQQWLGTRIPGTSRDWDAEIKDAAAALDAPRIVEIFDQFFKAHPAHDPRPKAAPTRKAADSLSRQVAPAKTGASTATPAQTQVRSFTADEYTSAAMRVVRLRKAGQEAEAQALEAELDAAVAQGRITA